MAAATAGLAVGCTPLRILLRAYPHEFDDDHRLVDRVMRAFVSTVIPGAPVEGPNVVRVFLDEYYPFAPYCSYFVYDLCRRSRERYGVGRFDRLDLEQRTRVVRDGFAADETTRRLYNGAILLAQLSFYAGIYDESEGCPLIDFPGRFQVVPKGRLSYASPARYLARQATVDGNYA